MPLPIVEDFRIDLGDQEVDRIRENIAAEIADRFAAATRNIYDRIADQLRKMKERLTTKDAVFRDSLFENLLSLIDLLPKLNIGNDPRISEICEDLKGIYTAPETIRQDDTLRAQKAREVDAILKGMGKA
jgi:hypothetical protein